MSVILCRHGATTKNLKGGTDDRWTSLHEEGVLQALETGPRLLAFCQANNIVRIQPITSGYDRTNATCMTAMRAFAKTSIEILPVRQDDRIGEIKFLPRDIHSSPDTPGIFGRVIEGPSLAEVLARLKAFDAEYLRNQGPVPLPIAFGHRTTHRLLAMIHLKRDIGWMEALPRMDNCELWRLGNGEIEVVHPGYPVLRDAPDARREALK